MLTLFSESEKANKGACETLQTTEVQTYLVT